MLADAPSEPFGYKTNDRFSAEKAVAKLNQSAGAFWM